MRAFSQIKTQSLLHLCHPGLFEKYLNRWMRHLTTLILDPFSSAKKTMARMKISFFAFARWPDWWVHYLAQKKNDLFHGPNCGASCAGACWQWGGWKRSLATCNFMNSCCRMDTVIKLIKGVIFVCFFYQKKRICYFQTFMSLFSQPKVLCSDSVLSYYCRCVTSRSYFVLHNNWVTHVFKIWLQSWINTLQCYFDWRF